MTAISGFIEVPAWAAPAAVAGGAWAATLVASAAWASAASACWSSGSIGGGSVVVSASPSEPGRARSGRGACNSSQVRGEARWKTRPLGRQRARAMAGPMGASGWLASRATGRWPPERGGGHSTEGERGRALGGEQQQRDRPGAAGARLGGRGQRDRPEQAAPGRRRDRAPPGCRGGTRPSGSDRRRGRRPARAAAQTRAAPAVIAVSSSGACAIAEPASRGACTRASSCSGQVACRTSARWANAVACPSRHTTAVPRRTSRRRGAEAARLPELRREQILVKPGRPRAQGPGDLHGAER